MSRIISAFLFLALACQAFAQIPGNIEGDVETVQVVRKFPVTITVADGGLYTWTITPPSALTEDSGNKFRITASPPGPLNVRLKMSTAVVDKDGKFLGQFKTEVQTFVFHVGGIVPTPTPTPPGPTPDPTPPQPVNVIPAPGVVVLAVVESGVGGPKLTPAQQNELYGEAFDAYTRAKCFKEGTTPAARVYDKDIQFGATVAPFWKELMARPGPVPRLIVTDGVSRSWEGPMPEGGSILNKVKSVLEGK